MIVKSMNESAIYAIGHAFGYYDYGEETGMVYAFFGHSIASKSFICKAVFCFRHFPCMSAAFFFPAVRCFFVRCIG